jgi:PA14 domain
VRCSSTASSEAPADGVYTFYLDTDDGARLLIGTTTVATRTRTDGVSLRSGNIAHASGKHPIQIDYFANTDQGNPNVLAVEWAGPGISKQAISADRLWH